MNAQSKTKQDFPSAPLSPGHGDASQDAAADVDLIRSEYARAVELIQRVRDISGEAGHGKVRYWSLPASKISADFFCSAEHPKNGWFGLLADAAGHGLASAIFTLHTPALFRESVLMGMSLPAIYERIERFLIRQRISGFFVCGLLVRIHGREIEIINAGMPDALLLDTHGKRIYVFPSGNLPFGIQVSTEVTPQRYRLRRGEQASLLLYSDGLSDLGGMTTNAGGADFFDFTAPATVDVFDHLVDKVRLHSRNAHDDVSIVMAPIPLETHREEDVGGQLAIHEHDIVHHANVAAALRIVENFDRGLVLTDTEQRILYVNPAFTAITGYSQAEAIGQTPRLLNSGKHGPAFYREMWQALSVHGAWSGEIWNRRKDGTLYLEWLDLRGLRDESGSFSHFLATFTVLSQYEKPVERLRHLALHDPLTGLANRILLADRGAHALHRADRAERSLAVLFIDLDRFQTINDSLGHDIGDQVLVEVAKRMLSILREDDTLCRYGGDEFVCLLHDIAKREDASLVADKLLFVLEQPVSVDGHQFKIGASIGISTYPSDGNVFDDLMVFAERAMQRAKHAGGNIYRFFSSKMAVAAQRQLEIEARLDAAIRNGELELHFQPKLDLNKNEVIGAEALVRWRDPQNGLVPPGTFIPVAEKSDLIAKIGNWVLTEACAALARWDSRLPEDFHVSVNVSPMQLERCDLSSEVRKTLERSGIRPERLQIEVTESMFIRETDDAAQTLAQIADMGVGIALDDFGTGYSNMTLLTNLPLDSFKLDQGFVRKIDSSPGNRAIAKAVWHLADGLNKNIVAEGIENCSECLTIKSLGYHIAQGYRFGKPMPEEDFLEYLSIRQPCICPCPESA